MASFLFLDLEGLTESAQTSLCPISARLHSAVICLFSGFVRQESFVYQYTSHGRRLDELHTEAQVYEPEQRHQEEHVEEGGLDVVVVGALLGLVLVVRVMCGHLDGEMNNLALEIRTGVRSRHRSQQAGCAECGSRTHLRRDRMGELEGGPLNE